MTSVYLSNSFPDLVGKAGWKTFAEAFDMPKCVKLRNDIAKEHAPPLGGGNLVREIIRVATEIQNPGFLKALEGPDLQESSHVSAQKLASSVMSLFSDTPDGQKLRAAVAAEGRRLDFRPKERNGFDATQCLIWFIEREKRLPTKKELNIECRHRLEFWTFLSDREMEYGSRIETDGGVWRVISCRRAHKLNTSAVSVKCFSLELTGDSVWEKPRWPTSEFSGTLRDFGLSGLPEKRGRKRK